MESSRPAAGDSTPRRTWSHGLFGYDAFISYTRRDGRSYAQRLAMRLMRDGDYVVYLDDYELDVGEQLPTLLRAARRSRMLVVVATPRIAESEYVPREVAAARASGRRIVPIDLHGTISRGSHGAELKSELRDERWENERNAAEEGPSDDVVRAIIRSGRGMRRRTQQRMALLIVALSLVALTVFAFDLAGERATALDAETRARRATLVQLGYARISEANGLSMLDRHDDARVVLEDARQLLDEAGEGRLAIAVAETTHLGEWHRPVITLGAMGDPVQSVAISGDGSLVAAAAYGRVTIWSVRDGRVVLTRRFPNPGWVTALRFRSHGDGVQLVMAGPKLVQGLDVGTLEVTDLFTHAREHPNYTLPKARHTVVVDGRFEVGLGDGQRRWQLPDRRDLTMGKLTDPFIFTAAPIDSAQVVVVAARGAVGVWDIRSGRFTRVRDEPDLIDYNHRVEVSRDRAKAAFVAGMTNDRVIVWALSDLEPINTLSGYQFGKAYAFTPDSEHILVGSVVEFPRRWGPLRLWNLYPTGRPTASFYGASGGITAVDVDDAGALAVTGSNDGVVEIWHLKEKLGPILEGADNALERVSLSSSARLTLGTAGGRVVLWDSFTGRAIRELETPRLDVTHRIALSPDGRTAAVSPGNGELYAHDLAVGTASRIPAPGRALWIGFDATSSHVCGLFYGAGTRFAAIDHAKATTSVELPVNVDGAQASCAAVGPAMLSVLVGYRDGSIRSWDAAGEIRWSAEGAPSRIERLAIGPQGRQVAAGSDDGTIRILDAASGDERSLLIGHEYPIRGLTFDDRGGLLLSVDERGSVIVWDVEAGRSITRGDSTVNFTITVESVAFARHGRTVTVQYRPGVRSVRNYFTWDFGWASRFRRLHRLVGTARARLVQEPGHAQSRAVLGDWLALRGLWSSAAEELQGAYDLGAEIDHELLARCLWVMGRTRRAHASFERAWARRSRHWNDHERRLVLDCLAK